jgi:predicted metal-dependent phosphoesterase TrpH
MRADLHVHSLFSARSGSLRFLGSRDCYSSPDDVYVTARRRGMDIVTLTDHDSIDGCLSFLSTHPSVTDFIVSEEISCRFPGTTLEVHLGAYGITEALHREMQPLRHNVFEVAGALRKAGVFVSLNHLLFFYREQLPLADYLRLVDSVPAVEARNGTMLREHNELVADLVRGARDAFGPTSLSLLGGSDAHTLRRVGLTWTDAPGESATEYLANLALGKGRPGGVDGTTAAVAMDVYGVVFGFVFSLLGVGPRDHEGVARAARLAFVVVSLPMLWLPLLLAWKSKRIERRQVHLALDALSARAESLPTSQTSEVCR